MTTEWKSAVQNNRMQFIQAVSKPVVFKPSRVNGGTGMKIQDSYAVGMERSSNR